VRFLQKEDKCTAYINDYSLQAVPFENAANHHVKAGVNMNLSEIHTAATFVQHFDGFGAKIEPLKKFHPNSFSRIHIAIRFHPRNR